jgi:hypothetical protein
MTEINDRFTTYLRDGPEWTASRAEFKDNLVLFQKRVQILPFVGGTLTVAPGTCAVLTLPSGRRIVFAEGMHWLGQRVPWGIYPVQYVDVMQRRTPIPLTEALCQDGWRLGIALDICWQVCDAARIVDVVDPVGNLVTAAKASVRAVIENLPHSAIVGEGGENVVGSDMLAGRIAIRLKRDPAIRGIKILQVFVTGRRGDERCLEITQETTVERARTTAEAVLVSHQKDLERERQSLVLLQAETERRRIEEERKVRIREAEIETEAKRLLIPAKWEEARLKLAVDAYAQRHELTLKVIEAYGRVLSEAAKLGQLETVGVSSRRRPELGGGGLEDALKQGLSNLQNVLQLPSPFPGSEQTTPVDERATRWARITAEVDEISRLDGVQKCGIEIDGKDGNCRINVKLDNQAIDIICHPGYPGEAPEVRWAGNGRAQVPVSWSEEMSLREILQEIRVTAE